MRTIKSQGEIEAAVCDAVSRFQQEFMGRGPRTIHAHLVENHLFVHLEGVLTAAEQRLIDGTSAANGKGADLLKQLRSHLVLAGRELLEQLVCEAAGAPPTAIPAGGRGGKRDHDHLLTGHRRNVVMERHGRCPGRLPPLGRP